MTKNPHFPPAPPGKPRRIVLVLFPRFQILDAAGPIGAFEIATRFRDAAYDIHLASTTGGMIASSAGVAMPTEKISSTRLASIDTLMIAGGQGTAEAMNDIALRKILQRAHGRVRRLASVCSGAFLLAGAGLLEHKRATTHWRQAARLQKLFPNVALDPDRIHVQDGDIFTSAGVTAGIDLSLAMIAADLGADIATEVAREMVVYAQRPGGQAQHSALLDLGGGEKFSELNAWMRTHLSADLSVDALAAKAAMSPRNFARAYAAETGITPAKAVERMRLEAARAALETGASIQKTATQTGFNDPERMRRAFIRFYGAPPASLRRTLRRA